MFSIHRLTTLIPVFLMAVGCASAPHGWIPSDSDRELAIVRVSYEYAKASDPRLTDTQAGEIAGNRCATWGYERAEVIPGNLRKCSVKSGERCDLWKVTREYQCTKDAAFAATLAR